MSKKYLLISIGIIANYNGKFDNIFHYKFLKIEHWLNKCFPLHK